ncbi:MAG: AMP-binding protein, partial [Pseudomonadales bacterium]|nr:AMP-binding protein [Pseudomonadales bacterium]
AAIGSIGKPLPSVEMRIGDNHEMQIRGAAVFKTYYNNTSATEESFTKDGWFKTGDMGRCTANGSYFITGRIKEQFKTAKGKYVAPVPIESLLGSNTDIEQICVMGQGRKQPIAVVVMSEQFRNENSTSTERLHSTLSECNLNLESHEKLDHIIVVKESWTIDNNLLTPTLKIKRQALEAKYLKLLEEDFSNTVHWL